MDMQVILTERIQVFESIIKNLCDAGESRHRYYQEKCEVYRRVLADLDGKPCLNEENR